MRVVTAPEEPLLIYPKVFLAGGITNCPEWQDEVIEELSFDEISGLLMNPRRKDFPIGDPNAAKEQITWEFNALNCADVFSMWFCAADSDQPICMYELGRHLARHASGSFCPGHVIVGVEPGYRREQDVQIQTHLVLPQLEISSALSDHIKAIANVVKGM